MPGSHLKVLQSCLRGVLELKDCTLMIIELCSIEHSFLDMFTFVLSCWNAQKNTQKSIWHLCTADVSSISLLPVEADSSDAEDIRSLHRWDLKGFSCASFVGQVNGDVDLSSFFYVWLIWHQCIVNFKCIFQQGKGVASERNTSVGSDPGTFLYFPTVSKLVK